MSGLGTMSEYCGREWDRDVPEDVDKRPGDGVLDSEVCEDLDGSQATC